MRIAFAAVVAALGCSSPADPLDVVDAADAPPDARCREVCCDVAAAICCNPVAPPGQQGCASGQKCTWLVVQGEPDPLGHVACVPDGSQPLGATCTFGPPGPMGFDDCAAGNICNDGNCRDLCADDPLHGCLAGHVCLERDGVFANDGEPPWFGACEPAPPPAPARIDDREQ